MTNPRLGLLFAAISLVMLGIAFAAVPLYRLFCQTLGIPVPRVLVGTAAHPPVPSATGDGTRIVTVRFVSNVSKDTPLRFTPLSFAIRARVGEPVLTAYEAQNTSPLPVNGVAVHEVYGLGGHAGDDMLPYIDLQQCFCFELQHYPARSTIRLPLSFTVRPDLPADIHTVTFAYTLFRALPDDPRVRPKNKNASQELTR